MTLRERLREAERRSAASDVTAQVVGSAWGGSLPKMESKGAGKGRRPVTPRRQLYSVWRMMMRRCYDELLGAYRNYGAKGVTVCKRWHTFDNFVADMAPRPNGYQLDRINSRRGYSPKNCRWVLPVMQPKNRRTAQLTVTYQGRTQTRAEWAAELGLDYHTVCNRLNLGWSPERAFTQPIGKRGSTRWATVTVDGVSKTVREWSASSGLSVPTIRQRLDRGWRPADAVSLPVGEVPAYRYDPERASGLSSGELKALVEKHGLSVNTVRNRLRRGYSLSEALELPLRARRKKRKTA